MEVARVDRMTRAMNELVAKATRCDHCARGIVHFPSLDAAAVVEFVLKKLYRCIPAIPNGQPYVAISFRWLAERAHPRLVGEHTSLFARPQVDEKDCASLDWSTVLTRRLKVWVRRVRTDRDDRTMIGGQPICREFTEYPLLQLEFSERGFAVRSFTGFFERAFCNASNDLGCPFVLRELLVSQHRKRLTRSALDTTFAPASRTISSTPAGTLSR